MANIYTGTAIIDRKLQILRADEQFYEYIGSENYASVAGNIHPEDLPFVKKRVADIQEGTEEEVFLIRMSGPGILGHHHVLTRLAALPPDEEMNSYVEIKIQDIEQLDRRIADICDENSMYNEFLEIWGERIFIYDAERDMLQVFSGGAKNRVYDFRGDLKYFRDHMLQEGLIAKEYIPAFNEFCSNIADRVKNFEGRMLFLKEGVDPATSIHVVRGKTIENSKGEAFVIGCISRRNHSGQKEEENNQSFELDITTGLLTKKAILGYTENLLHRKPKYNVNLCVIDVDNFKAVNDTLGHMFGDEVLAKVASVIKDAVEGKGIVGRIGGDEMFVVLEGVRNLSDLRGILRSIRNNVEWAYKDRKEVPKVTCSIGVSTYPADASNYDDLFQIADKMLYRAKQKGKNRYIVYSPEIHGDVLHGETETTVQNTAARRQDKEDLVLGMLEYAAKQFNRPINTILSDVGVTFGLDEIRLVYGEERKVMLENFWSATDAAPPENLYIDFVYEENFGHLYREHNMAVIDKLDLIEQLCPMTHKYMVDHGIKSALVYKMDYMKHEGYITYYKMSDLSRKWTDSDIANLTYISKAMELAINDQ
ncbi:MAG: GGDEF domain-containing protein [Lachnospiraceae bacterium]|nr:GGDEF domain-containing protein [Lachnospiraceae bacterium]